MHIMLLKHNKISLMKSDEFDSSPIFLFDCQDQEKIAG